MQPPKGRSPKDEFFKRGRLLLEDAANSTNPALAKLRTKMAKRYFAEDVLGTAKVRPIFGLVVGTVYFLVSATVCIYCAQSCARSTFVGVLLVCLLFGLLLLLFLFALTGVMTETTIAKVIVRMWDKVVAKLRFPGGKE
jgi:hypothetical protein